GIINIDENSIIEFIEEYQNTVSLTSSEICVLGEMLRIALLYRISVLCEEAEKMHCEREEAGKIFKRFNEYISDIKDGENDRKRAIDVWLSSTEELTPVLAETVLRLAAKEKGDTGEFRRILEMKLAGRHTTIDKMLAAERSLRTSMGVSCGNAVQSLNRLGSFDWDTVSSRLSTVERILENDPCGIYPQMDRDSRSYYVRCAEHIAREIDVSQEAVVLAAVKESEKHFSGNVKEKKAHVGYYLCGDGIRVLYKGLKHKFKVNMPKRPRGAAAAAAFMAGTATLAAAAVFIAGVLIIRDIAVRWDSVYMHLITGVLTVIPCIVVFMNMAVSIVQWIFAKMYKPLVLPSMDFSTGIPDGYKTFFVMPVLMKNSERVKEIMREIEIISLANRDKNIYFAVVADSAECDSEHAVWDEDVSRTGMEEAARLNRKYGTVREDGTVQDRFFFFYRPRKWHKCENKWIGRERKRGALIDFNMLVTGREDHNLLGMTKNVPQVKFVITVDADTRIPNDTIRKMAAIMAHPINQPEIDTSGGCPCVVSGYGILQPAVMTEPLREKRTAFAEIYTGEVGVDAYFARNSDFYFDACLEGIYTGKGMYDPAVFNEIAENTFRDETVLSHDLLEGSYMRTAFTSNITIYDGFPGNYGAYIKRQHRWIRGDWQLLPYKKRHFVNRVGRKVENPLNFISLYKITNNLQRSLAKPAALILFAAGMWFMPELFLLWHAIMFAYVFLPFFMAPSMKCLKKCAAELCFLPHEAYISADACVRTLWRINVSHKHLLQWVTAADAEKISGKTAASYFKMMWPCVLSGLLIPGLYGVLWLFAPYTAWYLSKARKEEKNDCKHRREIMAYTRRMWGFYEEYAADNSFLPPDNVQFAPEHKVAERTSPTNIGFYILCTATAARLGFITLCDAVFYITNTVNTIDRLEKWNGHLFNWYGTQKLDVLNPAFVSTVDSGNLAVCMICAAGLLAEERELYGNSPDDIIHRRFNGIRSLADIIAETGSAGDVKGLHIPDEIDRGNLQEWKAVLSECIDFCKESNAHKAQSKNEADIWIKRLEVTAETFLEEADKKNADCGQFNHGCVLCDTKQIEKRLNDFAYGMDFSVLYDMKKGCFSTGYIMRDNRMANSFYDVAVSEARLSVYFAVAKGDVPPEAFFRPARRFLKNGRGVLRSWSGTAFEYLLPELFFRAYPGLLWDKTIDMMIESQTKYGEEKGVPWGISESGYNMRDVNLNYKYKAHGVPELGMHREKNNELVIAPYASIMAIEHAPCLVIENMKKLKEVNAFGRYGFYEAVDFTDDRKGVVSSYMAHHIGMAFAGCVNYLEDGVIGNVFSNVPE
ncbi:MAG: hypothetical protein IJZ90_00390, partial [Clostridia bacterium]|nr:hypothetical protein [Clostridia bacterium]